uniref:Uncharacterized protein n=1 Tax=Dunaliella tertiolecta TaxID=3047 RepID=A0A7S3QV13_DUNTE
MSDDDCDEVINAAQQQALLPSRQAQGEALKSESLSLGLVDAIHHTVQVQCRLPESLASSNVSGCQCYFGDQVVPGTLDPSGALVCYAPPPKPCRGRYAQEKSCQLNVVVSGQIVASSTFQYTAVPFWRKPSLEGRFSGRLPTKEDERRLAEECRLVAPLLGGTCAGRGERSMSSLAKLARAIAGGRVRQHCEEREHKIQLLQQHIARLEAALSGSGSIQGLLPSSAGSVAALSAANATLQDELSHMRNQMSAKDDELAELKRQLRLKEQLWADMAKGSCCASAITPCNGTSAQCPPGSSCPTPASSADAAAATGAAAGGGKGSQRGGSAGGPRSKRQRQQQQQAAQPSHTAQQQQQQQQQQQMLLQQLCCGGAPCGPGAAPAAHASGEGGCSSWARVTNAQPAASLPLFDSLLASLPGLKELGNMRVPMSLPGLASSMPPASGPQAQLHQMQQLHTRSLQPPQLFPFAGQVPNLQAPAQAAPLGTTCASPGAAASAPASAAPSAAGKLGLPAHVVASAGVAAPCAANPSSCATACTPAPAPSGSCCSTGQAAPHHLQQQQQQQLWWQQCVRLQHLCCVLVGRGDAVVDAAAVRILALLTDHTQSKLAINQEAKACVAASLLHQVTRHLFTPLFQALGRVLAHKAAAGPGGQPADAGSTRQASKDPAAQVAGPVLQRMLSLVLKTLQASVSEMNTPDQQPHAWQQQQQQGPPSRWVYRSLRSLAAQPLKQGTQR